MAYSDQNTILLSWEKVPFAEDYVVYKDGEEYSRTYITNSDYFPEVDIDIEKDMPNFKVEAYDANGEKIAESINVKINPAQLLDAGDPLSMKFQLGNKKYRVNGEEKGEMDTAPVIKNGRTFLVIRHITEEIGASISWNGDEKMVTITTKDNKTIRLWIGKPMAHVDGYEIKIDENEDVIPFISEGRTLLPLRFVSDNLGADDVLWNTDTKEIELVWESFYKKYLREVLKTEEEDDNIILSNGHFWLIFVGKDSELESGKYYRINLKFIDQSTTRYQPHGAEEILIDENKKIMGSVISNKDGKIVIQNKSGEKRTFTYSEFDCTTYGILENSVISAFYDNDNQITYWEYIRNDALESDPATEIKVILTRDIESDRGFIKIQPEQIIEGEKEEKILFMGNNELSDFEEGTLYKITYQTNWLGRNIVTETEEVEQKRKLRLIKSDTDDLEFREETNMVFIYSIVNKSDIDLEVEYFCTKPVGFEGSVELTAQTEMLKKNQAKKIKVIVSPEDTPPGEYTLIYGAKSDELIVSEEIKISILKDETGYEIIFPEKIIVPSNFSRFEVMCKAKNNAEKDVTFDCISNFNSQMVVSYSKRRFTIPAGCEIDFLLKIKLEKSFLRKSGDKRKIRIECTDSFSTKFFIGEILFDAPKYPQIKIKVKDDKTDKDMIIIDADIDWNGLTPGDISLTRNGLLSKSKNEGITLPVKEKKVKSGSLATFILKATSSNENISSDAFHTINEGVFINMDAPKFENITLKMDGRKATLDFGHLYYKYILDYSKVELITYWGDGTSSVKVLPENYTSERMKIEHTYQTPVEKRENEKMCVYACLRSKSGTEIIIWDSELVEVKFTEESTTQIRPIVKVDCILNKLKNKITIDGNIDWMNLEPGPIDIGYYKGWKIASDIKLPYVFRYSENKNYVESFEILAYTKNRETVGRGFATQTDEIFDELNAWFTLKKEGRSGILTYDGYKNLGKNEQIVVDIIWGDGKEESFIHSRGNNNLSRTIVHNYEEPEKKREKENYLAHIILTYKKEESGKIIWQKQGTQELPISFTE
ncbi:MAG: copper amine oxidase N-terminal domain-containing protein [Caldisericia bacterium]